MLSSNLTAAQQRTYYPPLEVEEDSIDVKALLFSLLMCVPLFGQAIAGYVNRKQIAVFTCADI